jgi:transposase
VARQRFSRQFKEDAVRMVLEDGFRSEKTGRRLGIHDNNINRWVREYQPCNEALAESGLTRERLETELKRLRKENKRLVIKRAILKKAAFFAKESSNGSTFSISK